MTTRRIVVNDTMQADYVYFLAEPVGRRFASGFTPQLTPKEMLRLGVFGGKYAVVTDSEGQQTILRFEREVHPPARGMKVDPAPQRRSLRL